MDYSKYIDVAKEIYRDEPSGHDFSHIERVLNFCKEMMKTENADDFIVTISAIFHDVHRVLSSKEGKFISAEEAMPEVENILNQFDLPKEKLNGILYVIKEHDNKTTSKDIPIELQIIQDADILDALGETGLKRTLAYCKKHNIPLTNTNFDLDCSEYIPDVNPISTLHYIHRTMIPQADMLHTSAAKNIAKDKIKVLCDFVKHNLNNK